MKLIILTEYYLSAKIPNSGAFIHARAQLYVELGHEVLVLSNPQVGLPKHAEFYGIQIIRPANLEAAQALVKAFSPDVMAIHFPYRGTFPTILATSLSNEYPLVAWIHGYETMYTAFFGYHHGLSRLLSIPHDWLKLRYLRGFLADCVSVVYVSKWIRQLAERSMRYTHPNSFVIANPVNMQLFSPRTEPHPESQLRGIALRSLKPIYGLDIAIRAYARVDTSHLTIIGTGSLEQELRSLIATTGSNSTLLARGFPHAQVPEILRGYDYFVAPSRNETQGLAMCEAMSCGLPVVATRVGGIPEFVRDGIDGYLVPPEEPAVLRAAVLRLVSEPERLRQMGQNARQHMLDICDGQKIAARELQVLQEAYIN